MAEDSVVVRFGGAIEGLTAAVDSARASIESLASPFTGLTASAAAFGEAFAAAFAVREVAHFAESMAALGTETIRASQILGISTEEIGGLKLVAKASGGSLDELQTAFGRLSRNVIDETPNAKRALDALGLSFADIRNKTPEQQLELLATKFASIKDGADKDAIAIELLGRAGVNLIPIFNQGAAGFKRWAGVAKEFGVSLSKEDVAALEEMHAALIEVNTAIVGTSIQAFLGLKGALMGAVQLIKDIVAGFTIVANEGGAAASAVWLLEAAFKGLVAEMIVATSLIKDMWAVFSFGAEGAGMWVYEIITQIANLGLAMKNLSFAGVKDEWAFFSRSDDAADPSIQK